METALGEVDSLLESQIFKQLEKKKGNYWPSKLIFILSTFHFHPLSLLLARKNYST
jgi:hypothetical protein